MEVFFQELQEAGVQECRQMLLPRTDYRLNSLQLQNSRTPMTRSITEPGVQELQTILSTMNNNSL